MDFAKNDPLGFRYIERMNIKPKKYNKKIILRSIKQFIKQQNYKNITKKKRKNVLERKRQTKKNRTIGISS